MARRTHCVLNCSMWEELARTMRVHGVPKPRVVCALHVWVCVIQAHRRLACECARVQVGALASGVCVMEGAHPSCAEHVV